MNLRNDTGCRLGVGAQYVVAYGPDSSSPCVTHAVNDTGDEKKNSSCDAKRCYEKNKSTCSSVLVEAVSDAIQ